jgi:hypothetical protein
MTTVLIAPVATPTKGGYAAEVTSIDPADHDCLRGTIDIPGAGRIDARWNDNGICRDNDDACNLKITTREVANVLEKVKNSMHNSERK